MTDYRIAKITSTHLGFEDHGIFTAMIHVDYGGSAQGIGGYDLRPGGRDAADWITRTLNACGVDRWERVQGRTILVYFEGDEYSSRPAGIGPLPTEPGTKFMFDNDN